MGGWGCQLEKYLQTLSKLLPSALFQCTFTFTVYNVHNIVCALYTKQTPLAKSHIYDL